MTASRRRELVLFAVVLAVVVAAHLLLRPADWRYEWQRAIFGYGFVTVFTAPISLAFGSSLAARTRRGIASSWAGGVHERQVGSTLLQVTGTAVGVHLLGLGVVSAVAYVTARTGPRLSDVFPAVSPVLLLVIAVLFGWVVGWVAYRSWWVGPLVAAGWFGATLVLFTSGVEVLVRVGGTTASMLEYSVSINWLIRQWACLIVAVVALAMAIRFLVREPLLGRRDERMAAVFGISFIGFLVVTAIATHNPPSVLEAADETWECSSEDPTVCLTPGYQSWRDELTSNAGEAFERWVGIGGTAPREVTLNPRRSSESGVMVLDPTLGSSQRLGGAVVSQQLSERCIEELAVSDSTVFSVWTDLIDYVNLPQLRQTPGFPAGFEAWLSNETPDQQRSRAMAHLSTLRARCE